MRGLMKLGQLGLLVRGVLRLMKLGAVALAGYGAFQLYERYGDRLKAITSGQKAADAATSAQWETFGDRGSDDQLARDAVTAALV